MHTIVPTGCTVDTNTQHLSRGGGAHAGHQSTSGSGFRLDGGIPSAGVRRNGC